MAITLDALYSDTKKKYKLNLLAGNESMQNVVSWIHLIEDVSTTDFIRGNELIVTTGLGVKDEYWLERFIQYLISYNAIGLIVNTGKYIKEIPTHTIDYCKQINFPLLTMPWEIHLVDILQDFCHQIICAEQVDINESEIFKNVIYHPEKREVYENYLIENNYDLEGSYAVIIIDLESRVLFREKELLLIKMKTTLSNILNKFSHEFCFFINNKEFFIVFHDITKEQLIGYSKKIMLGLKKEYSGTKLRMGVGPIIWGIENLKKSVKRGELVLQIKKNENLDINFYDDIGVNKILLEVEERQILVDMYNNTLGVLETYDQEHNTNYLETLRLYIFNNYSIQAVSNITFTHRNTINYRIKKIKNLLGVDFSLADNCFTYQLAFYIKDIIG